MDCRAVQCKVHWLGWRVVAQVDAPSLRAPTDAAARARPSRRVSEWLAVSLEMTCRETGCGFESRALRLGLALGFTSGTPAASAEEVDRVHPATGGRRRPARSAGRRSFGLGAWRGARVASRRCAILCPGGFIIATRLPGRGLVFLAPLLTLLIAVAHSSARPSTRAMAAITACFVERRSSNGLTFRTVAMSKSSDHRSVPCRH